MIKSVRRFFDPFKKEDTVIVEFTPEFSAELEKKLEINGWAYAFWSELKEKLDEK